MRYERVIPPSVADRWKVLLETLVGLSLAETARISRYDGEILRGFLFSGAGVDQQALDQPLETADYALMVPVRQAIVILPGTCDLQQRDALQAFYLGLPIYWPNGILFGVLDVCCEQPKPYDPVQRQLLQQYRDNLEDQLALLCVDNIDLSSVSSARAQAEEAMHISEERFRLLIDHTPDDFFLHDEKGRFFDVNQSACEHLGYSREELLQLGASDVSKNLSQEQKEILWARTEPGTAVRIICDHIRKDGSSFPAEVLIFCHIIRGKKMFLGMVRDITERVSVEKKLQELNAQLEHRVDERTRQLDETMQLLQAVMDSASDAITLINIQGRLLLVNKAAEHYFGKPMQRLPGSISHELFDADTNRKVLEQEEWIIANAKSSSIEETVSRQGHEAIYLTTRSPRFDDRGKVIGLVSISRDITERKVVESELHVQKERLALATEAAHLGVWDYDLAKGMLVCNHEWHDITGLPNKPGTLTIEVILSTIHPDDRDDVIKQVKAVMEKRDSELNMNFRIIRTDGAIRCVSVLGRLTDQVDISLRRIIGVMTDVTDKREAEEKLQHSYESLRQAERLARIGSWTLDLADGKFSCSEMMTEMNGIQPGDAPLTMDDIHRVLFGESRRKAIQAIETCIKTGEPYGIDVEQGRIDGSTFSAHMRGQALFDKDGNVYAVSGTIQDISEQVEARAQLTALADNVPNSAIYRFGRNEEEEYGFAYLSAGIQRLSGITAEAIMADKRAFLHVIHPDDLYTYLNEIDKALSAVTSFDHSFRIASSRAMRP